MICPLNEVAAMLRFEKPRIVERHDSGLPVPGSGRRDHVVRELSGRLDERYEPIGQIQCCHRCGRREGMGAPLEAANETTVASVLIDRHPNQVTDPLN